MPNITTNHAITYKYIYNYPDITVSYEGHTAEVDRNVNRR